MKLDKYKESLDRYAEAVSHFNLVQTRCAELAEMLDRADDAVHHAEASVQHELGRLNEALVLGLVELPRQSEEEATAALKTSMAQAWRIPPNGGSRRDELFPASTVAEE